MWLFDKIFGKKTNSEASKEATEASQLKKGDTFVSPDDEIVFRVFRPLAEEQKDLICKSTLLLRTGQLYMHYWTDGLIRTDHNDPEWQHQGFYFWKAEEPFPKKSLPPKFETFKTKFFLFKGDTSNILLNVELAIPWFGMPGLGERHFCEINGQKITIPELYEKDLIEYCQPIALTSENSAILTDRNNYFILIDERIARYQNGDFYSQGVPIPIDLAYGIGGIHVVKKVGLN